MKKWLSTRREFISGIVLSLPVITFLSACGSSNNSDPTTTGTPVFGGNCFANGTALETTGITESHAHTIQITAAQIAAADPTALFATSVNSGHTHNVQLTSSQYSSLESNQGVAVVTGPAFTDNHTHTLTLNCA